MPAREVAGLRLPWLVAVIVVVAYAAARLHFNVEYRGATWQQLYDLSAPLPFGHRVLVPLLSRPLVGGLGLDVEQAFAVLEAAFAGLLVWCMRGVLATCVDARHAAMAAMALLGWLAYPFLLRHGWAIFYPYDTAAMAFTAAFLWATLARRWRLAVAIVALAASNRETTLFFPLLAGVLVLRELPPWRLAGFLAALLAAHVAVRGGITLALPDLAGSAMHLYVDGAARVSRNAIWLIQWPNALLLIASLGFLPLFWLCLGRQVPDGLRLLRLPAWAMFLSLTLVGNLYEPRIFGELLVVAWLPVAVAATGWLTQRSVVMPEGGHNAQLAALVERWGMAAVILPWAVAQLALQLI